MDRVVAYSIVSEKLRLVQAFGFSALAKRIGTHTEEDVQTEKGLIQVVTDIGWETPNVSIRVRCLAHDKSSYRFDPLEEEVIVAKVEEQTANEQTDSPNSSAAADSK